MTMSVGQHEKGILILSSAITIANLFCSNQILYTPGKRKKTNLAEYVPCAFVFKIFIQHFL